MTTNLARFAAVTDKYPDATMQYLEDIDTLLVGNIGEILTPGKADDVRDLVDKIKATTGVKQVLHFEQDIDMNLLRDAGLQ